MHNSVVCKRHKTIDCEKKKKTQERKDERDDVSLKRGGATYGKGQLAQRISGESSS